MYASYIVGGMVPLFAYFILSVPRATPVSIVVTLAGLFALGVATTKYTKGSWFKAGGRILSLGTVALVVGYIVGGIAAKFS